MYEQEKELSSVLLSGTADSPARSHLGGARGAGERGAGRGALTLPGSQLGSHQAHCRAQSRAHSWVHTRLAAGLRAGLTTAEAERRGRAGLAAGQRRCRPARGSPLCPAHPGTSRDIPALPCRAVPPAGSSPGAAPAAMSARCCAGQVPRGGERRAAGVREEDSRGMGDPGNAGSGAGAGCRRPGSDSDGGRLCGLSRSPGRCCRAGFLGGFPSRRRMGLSPRCGGQGLRVLVPAGKEAFPKALHGTERFPKGKQSLCSCSGEAAGSQPRLQVVGGGIRPHGVRIGMV